MAVNTTEIGTVYSSLMAAMLVKYDDMWASNEIDAETYAKLVGEASSQIMQLAADLVQKQESLDKDSLIKDKQLEIAEQERLAKVYEVTNLLPEQLKTAYADRVLKDKEAAKLGLDNVMKLSEAAREADANFVYTPKYTGV